MESYDDISEGWEWVWLSPCYDVSEKREDIVYIRISYKARPNCSHKLHL